MLYLGVALISLRGDGERDKGEGGWLSVSIKWVRGARGSYPILTPFIIPIPTPLPL